MRKSSKFNLRIRDDRSIKFISFIFLIIYFVVTNLHYYAQNLEAIEEPTFYGFQGLLHYARYVTQSDLNLTNYNFVLLIFPESIIDWILNYILNFDASKIWIFRHIFRQILIFGLLLSILLRLTSKSFLPLILVLFSSSIQVLFKIHWDAGSTYSIVWFLSLIYFFTNIEHFTSTKKSNFFIFGMSIITLPGYTNPPNMLAAWTVVFVGIALEYAKQQESKFNFKILFTFVWSIPSLILFLLTVLKDTTINESIKIFSGITPTIVPISQWIQVFQGYGLWWTTGTFLNGTLYWPHASVLTSKYVEFIRLFLLILPFILIFLLWNNLTLNKSNLSRIHLVLGMSTLFYFILTVNMFNLFGFLIEINNIFAMYRDPARKFGALYFTLFLILIASIIDSIKTFCPRIVKIYCVLTFILLALLFSPNIKKGHSFFPNPSKEMVSSISEDVEVVLSFKQNQYQEICLNRSGQLDYDYLVKNIFKAKIYNQLKGNFAPLDIGTCQNSKQHIEYLNVIIIDPEKHVDIFFDSSTSLVECQYKWTNSLFVLSPGCTLSLRETSPKSVAPYPRLAGPTSVIEPQIYDYPFYVISLYARK